MKTQEQLTFEDFRYINAIMCNDEYSSDAELFDCFEKELDISRELAKTIVAFRNEAFVKIDFDIQDYL